MKTKKNYLFVALGFMIASVLLSMLTYYWVGTIEWDRICNSMNSKLEQIEEKIKKNQTETDTLVAQLKDDSLSKAKALSIMILESPSILKDVESLEETRIALGLDEINISDENGNIIASTSAYAANASDLSNHIPDFLPAIQNKSFSKTITEDVSGTKRFYTGVSRLDKPGVVQITSTPAYLRAIMSFYDISSVCAEDFMLKNGYTAIIDLNSYKYLSHSDKAMILKGVQIPKENFSSENGMFIAALAGKKSIVRYKKNEDKIIMAAVPEGEIYSMRNSAVSSLAAVLPVMLIITLLLFRHSFKKAGI
ncbi:MAG: hypothetical protein N2Z57_01535 [Oscillospiraceae bacterium]|nr:hypothetical protein [Oscillospiraceae bacterium]